MKAARRRRSNGGLPEIAVARYKLTLAYDGTAFSGSQRQIRCRTVQAELEKAARGLGWNGSSVLLAGRTDAGVHATGQVAALDLEWDHGPVALRDALNAGLPRDLVVTEAQAVGDAFHPRFDAVSRCYGYEVRCAPLRHPIEDQWAWRVWPPVNVEDLSRIAALFRGTHDFGAFGSASRKGGGTNRTVAVSEWREDESTLRYEIAADGFLYRMVRRLVFVQVAAGQGKCSEQVIRTALAGGRRIPGLPAGTAPAEGLRLLQVQY